MPKSKRNLYILAAAAFVFIFAAIYFLFVFQKSPKLSKVDRSAFEVKSIIDIEVTKRPFVTLTPTAPGAEIIISIENMSEFDNIEYELTYLADNPQIPGEKIQRGSTGIDVDTKSPKYKKSMLLGTASRGVSNPDRGIEEGKLTLHMFKGNTEYQSETPWYLFEIGLTTTEISTPDGNLSIKTPKLTKDYFAIVSDTVGLPPEGDIDKGKAELPIYGVFSTTPKFTQKADLTLRVKGQNSKLYIYNNQNNTWGNIDSTQAGENIKAKIEIFSTYVVVSQK